MSGPSASSCGSTPQLSICILGTGAGATNVLYQEASSSFVLLLQEQPLLLADVGLGVVHAYHQHFPHAELPAKLYVSHNHTDHAGELPVLLAVQAAKGQRMHVLAHKRVLQRLQDHRLQELQSTGQNWSYFATWQGIEENQPTLITPDGSVTMQLVRSQHSELCYGAIFYYLGEPVLGWTADSGHDPHLYDQLSVAPVMLMDARHKATFEHASFEQAAKLARHVKERGVSRVLITGYGRQQEAPSEDVDLGGAEVVRPGQHVTLRLSGGSGYRHGLLGEGAN